MNDTEVLKSPLAREFCPCCPFCKKLFDYYIEKRWRFFSWRLQKIYFFLAVCQFPKCFNSSNSWCKKKNLNMNVNLKCVSEHEHHEHEHEEEKHKHGHEQEQNAKEKNSD